MHLMNISIDYNNIFILLSIINIIIPFLINYSCYFSLFLYCNTISFNYIMYKDFYFEMKNKYSNINFILMPNYYPSNRTYNKIIWYINILFIYSSVLLYCFDFWINHYNGFNNNTFNYMFTLTFISFISILNVILGLLLVVYSSIILSSFILDRFKLMTFNYLNKQPLFYKKQEEPCYICWVCDRILSKNKTLKKLNCPCQEYFHPDCIDKYLGLYDNYCRDGHKIAKYNHIV